MAFIEALVLSYKFARCLHVAFVIRKYAYILRVGMGIFYWGDFSMGRFSIGREASVGEQFRGNFSLGEFAEISTRNSFYLSYFFLVGSIISTEILRVTV